jgi:hypothetical protein
MIWQAGTKNVHHIHTGWDGFFDPPLWFLFSSVIGCHCEILVLILHTDIFYQCCGAGAGAVTRCGSGSDNGIEMVRN